MRAVIVSEFGDPSVLKVGETDIPTHNPKQCLIRLHACGVNPVDTYIRSGKYPKLPSLPFIPGKDGAGVVESIGSEVHNVKVGDRVYIFGAITGSYADYTICNDSNVFKLPNHISFEEGACLGTPAFTAYRALFQKANGKSGESVFIHGASGGVGLSAIELALSAGLTVVGTAGTSIGTETILKLGVKHAFNHNDPNYLQEIQALYPKGFNICLEMLASTNLSKDFQIMPSRGRIAIIGNRGEILINPRDIMSKELQVYGVALLQSTTEELKEASEYIGQCLEKRQLNPLITMRYNFENAPSAHTEIINRTNLSNGNIILVP